MTSEGRACSVIDASAPQIYEQEDNPIVVKRSKFPSRSLLIQGVYSFVTSEFVVGPISTSNLKRLNRSFGTPVMRMVNIVVGDGGDLLDARGKEGSSDCAILRAGSARNWKSGRSPSMPVPTSGSCKVPRRAMYYVVYARALSKQRATVRSNACCWEVSGRDPPVVCPSLHYYYPGDVSSVQ